MQSAASSSTSPSMHLPTGTAEEAEWSRLARISSDDQLGCYTSSKSRTVISNNPTPLLHTPLDVILVVSVLPSSAVPATEALKVRAIKATLDFVRAQLGAHNRLSLVTFEVGLAHVPIHSFGYGRSHDPASLWLISNHTSGTYTFVKDWHDLRDCLAGCLGGLMSTGLVSIKLHMKIIDAHRFRIRIAREGRAR